jgi:tRNA-splicing ligase RtcB (3'-phosphate/5'-hydroxy nucleic acid ligase)
MPDCHSGYGMPIGGVLATHGVIIHRKGAVSAREGEVGIIPGSPGTHSFIVKGKGNPESFTNCSHGAGRRMGRHQAQKEPYIEQQKAFPDQ